MQEDVLVGAVQRDAEQRAVVLVGAGDVEEVHAVAGRSELGLRPLT